MKLIENNILLLSSNLFTKIFVPTKNRKLINVRIHPTAKQKENFLGDIITNGNKKKLNTKSPNPNIIRTINIGMLLSTSIKDIILLAI